MAVDVKRVKVNDVLVISGEEDQPSMQLFRVLRVWKRKSKLLVVDQEGNETEHFACDFDKKLTREQSVALRIRWRI